MRGRRARPTVAPYIFAGRRGLLRGTQADDRESVGNATQEAANQHTSVEGERPHGSRDVGLPST
jgi:hypothetical protein